LQAFEVAAVVLLALQYALSNAAETAVPASIEPMTPAPVTRFALPEVAP